MILALLVAIQLIASAHAGEAADALPAFEKPEAGKDETIQLPAQIARLNEQIAKGVDLDKVVAAQKDILERIRKDLPKASPDEAMQLFRGYSYLVGTAGLRSILLTKSPAEWDLSAIQKELQITVPHKTYSKLNMIGAFSPEVRVIRRSNDEVVISVSPEVILSTGIRYTLRQLNERNYETAVRCLFGFTFAQNYANAVLVSGDSQRAASAMQELEANGAQSFCMKYGIPDLTKELLEKRLNDARDIMVRLSLGALMPTVDAIFSPELRAVQSRQVRSGNVILDLNKNMEILLITPELIEDHTEKDSKSVLSKAEANALAENTKNLDVSFLRGDESFLTVFDADLLTDLKAMAGGGALALDDKEIERRARLAQVMFLAEAMRESSKYLVADLVADQLPRLLGMAQELALKGTLSNLAPIIIPKFEDSSSAQLDVIALNAMARHAGRLRSMSLYNQWINQVAAALQSKGSPNDVFKLQFAGFEQAMTKAARELETTTGANIKDEDLPYKSPFVWGMLQAEINKSSSRVQQWIDYVQNSGAYTDQVRAQGQVETYIRKMLKDPKACEVQPIGYLDKANIFFSDIGSSLWNSVFESKPVAPTTADQNLEDCLRFVRLSEYANVRNSKNPKGSMAQVVGNIESFWSKKNRAELVDYYRKLLRTETLDQFRLLDLVEQDKKALSIVLSESADPKVIHQAVGTARKNLLAHMKELTEAKDLNALAPMILHTSLIDGAFTGESSLWNPTTQSVLHIELSDVIKTQKVEDFAGLRSTRDDQFDLYLAISKFHAQMKDRMKIDLESRQREWDTLSSQGTNAVIALLGIMIVRRLLSPLSRMTLTQGPAFWLQQEASRFVEANRYLGSGYLSYLTAIYAADGVVQQFVTLPATRALAEQDGRYAYSEAVREGAQILSPIKGLNNSLATKAMIDEAESRRTWAIALTGVAVAVPLTFPVINKVYAWQSNRILRNRHSTLTKIKAEDLNAYERTINDLRNRKELRFRRVFNYKIANVTALGLEKSGSALEALNLYTLQKALRLVEKSNDLKAIARARRAYRSLLQDLYEEMSHFAMGEQKLKEIYSEIYAGKGMTHYIDDVISAFEKEVMAL